MKPSSSILFLMFAIAAAQEGHAKVEIKTENFDGLTQSIKAS